MKAKPEDITPKEVTSGVKQSFLFNEKSYAYPASKHNEIAANALSQTAYGMDVLHHAKSLTEMSEFTKACLVFKNDAFLRDGFSERRYSELYSEKLEDGPEAGQPLSPKATYKQTIHDDYTGKNTYKLVAKVDQVQYLATEAYIDYELYRQGVEQCTSQTAVCKARDYDLLSMFYACAAAPGFTLTTDRNMARLLDENLKPTTEPQKSYFDKNQNHLIQKIIKEDIVGQVRTKHKNIKRYSTEKGALPYYRKEVKQVTAVGENDAQQNKLYLVKDSQNKIQHPEGISVHTSYLALTQAIRDEIIGMTEVDTPSSRAGFNPYQSQKDSTNFEDYGKTTPDRLRIIMNPYDGAYIKQGIVNTSESGNYKITLEDVIAQGVTIYPVDSMPFGSCIIEEKDIFEIVEFHDSSYTYNADGLLGTQFGRIYMGKIKIGSWRCGVKLVPSDGGFIPATNMTNLIYKDIKPA